MKPKPLSDFDAVMLKKRMLVESVINQLKNQSQLERIPATPEFRQLSSQRSMCVDCLYVAGEKTITESPRALDEIKDLPVTDITKHRIFFIPNSRLYILRTLSYMKNILCKSRNFRLKTFDRSLPYCGVLTFPIAFPCAFSVHTLRLFCIKGRFLWFKFL